MRYTTIVAMSILLCTGLFSSAAAQPIANGDRRQFEGFSFDLPSGWWPLAPRSAKTKADILLGGVRAVAKAEIMVDVESTSLPKLQAAAERLAKRWGGAVLPGFVDLDSEKALQVHVAQQGDSLSPRRAIVAFHSGRLYLVMAGAAGARDVSDAVEHVRMTWKWSENGLPSASAVEPNGMGHAVMLIADHVLQTVCVLGLLFVIYGTIVLLRRRLRGERAQGEWKWINVYTILAVLFASLGVAGIGENVKFVVRGAGLPTEPADRSVFVVGLFVAPTLLLIVAAVFALLARRKVNKDDSRQPG